MQKIIIDNLLKSINDKDLKSYIENKDKLLTLKNKDLKQCLIYLNQLDNDNKIRFIDYLYIFDMINNKINE